MATITKVCRKSGDAFKAALEKRIKIEDLGASALSRPLADCMIFPFGKKWLVMFGLKGYIPDRV